MKRKQLQTFMRLRSTGNANQPALPHLPNPHHQRHTLRTLHNKMEQGAPQAPTPPLRRHIQTQSKDRARHSNQLLDLWRRQSWNSRPIHSRSPDTSRPQQPTGSSPQIMQQQEAKQTHPTPLGTPPHAPRSPLTHQPHQPTHMYPQPPATPTHTHFSSNPFSCHPCALERDTASAKLVF